MTMIVDRQPVIMVPLGVRCNETRFEWFATLLVLRLFDATRKDLHSCDARRIAEARRFIHSTHAQSLASGVGYDIEWLRGKMEGEHYFVELPDLNSGKRFRSYMRPVVIRGNVELMQGSQFVRIVCREPFEFSRDYSAFTSADWIEVPGPARWLSDDEYIELLDASCDDRRYVQAARATLLRQRKNETSTFGTIWMGNGESKVDATPF